MYFPNYLYIPNFFYFSIFFFFKMSICFPKFYFAPKFFPLAVFFITHFIRIEILNHWVLINLYIFLEIFHFFFQKLFVSAFYLINSPWLKDFEYIPAHKYCICISIFSIFLYVFYILMHLTISIHYKIW